MNRKLLIPALIFILLIVASPLVIVLSVQGQKASGAQVSDDFTEESGFLLGTVIRIKLYGEEDPVLFEKIFDEIDTLESLLSVNIPESQISGINHSAGKGAVNVAPRVLEVVQKGLEYSRLSEGAFDITIGPLVSLWHIGHEDARVPEPDEIDAALEVIDYRKVEIDAGASTVYLPEEGMALDLGGIAKGYIADEIREILIDAGRSSAIVNLGGNVAVLGAKPSGVPFKIGVQNPQTDRGEYIGILSVEDKSIVSSGAYERYLESDGKLYHHILSPFTGYPVEAGLLQVTIVSDFSVDGDGLSTTVFSLGLEKGRILIESLEGIEAVFVTGEKDVYLTSGLEESFRLTDSDYQLIPSN